MKKLLAIVAYTFGTIATLYNLILLAKLIGFWGLVIAIIILPVTMIAGPIFIGAKTGFWQPLIIIYTCNIFGLWMAYLSRDE